MLRYFLDCGAGSAESGNCGVKTEKKALYNQEEVKYNGFSSVGVRAEAGGLGFKPARASRCGPSAMLEPPNSCG